MTATNVVNLEELKNPELVSSISKLQIQIDGVEKFLKMLCESDPDQVYNTLDAAGKAQHDLFVTYALNSLFWVYLRTKGRDAANHAVKSELGRVQEHMVRAKQLEDRALAPRLDTDAAKRFVRGGLWQPQSKEDKEKKNVSRPRKRKHSVDTEDVN
jgi:exosome complex protein LRP1